jgi:aspartate/methionine/tyrosine aminotransferase
MKLEAFALERLQSIWEHRVAWNVAESGVQPLRVEELADTAEAREALLRQDLCYTQTNGTPELRAAIAVLYPGASPDHVEVTNGGSEANCISLWHLVEPGDEVVMMTPNYMQAGGIARALGATVHRWPLVEDAARWRVDGEALARLVTSRTKLILVCNPNNPTGACFGAADLEEICRHASRVGAWILSDEIYRGAELEGDETPTMWGRYERVLVTSGLSKAYALPGLRIGWVVGPTAVIQELWGIHDYTTIAPGAMSDRLARVALAPERRQRLLARTRGIVRTNYPIVKRWIERRGSMLSHIPPRAGAIAFVRYDHPINSTTLVERLRAEQSVLVVPGDHFEMDGYLRIGFGSDPAHLTGSLTRIAELVDRLAAEIGAR